MVELDLALIYQTAQIRELEARAENQFDLSATALMQRSGKAAFDMMLKQWPTATRIAVVCGPGNNGGDGYVLAQVAHAQGLDVNVWQVGSTQHLKEAALSAFNACLSAHVPIKAFHGSENFQQADIIVDAIYGTGFKKELSREELAVIEAINASGIPVLAIDVPSGLNADTGFVAQEAVKAEATITFIGMKSGLLTGSGKAYAGELYCDQLQLPAELFSPVPSAVDGIELKQFLHYLKPRARDAHKGDSGHVLIVGGDDGFTGAPRMAAEAALRVGAGLVTIATHSRQAAMLNLVHPEIMCYEVKSALALKRLLAKATVVVIGPGMGQTTSAKMFLKTVLASSLPLVVDADALNLLAKKPNARGNWILTPHPGEAGRLLGQTTADISHDRFAALKKLQENYAAVAVLKGSGTLVLAPRQKPALCYAGNPGMATAGMGDVLSGVIGGLVSQGIPLSDAAKLGVCLHASAGDIAAEISGERGMLATDLMPYLHLLVNPELDANS
jgi:NAD(P)H-hydrate epimerase